MSADSAPMVDDVTSKDDPWPFSRLDPDRIVLGVGHGVTPAKAPPVRIFLGTEEAQYRAERVFFHSIEKFRDPARVYEIFLMKNLAGFDRRRWRTGFTNYRYAIPDLAGGHGRAIYNDVDQIYLADPAELFDLDMDGHGYLAISAKDTSVMLIDCERMRPMWNRARASTGNKYSLLNRPAKTPGLWGVLDSHWNARDLEYVEGRTKCLHYTALHQQPWEPFPEHYSYHPNPLGYLWHGLEREADAQGYQICSAETPSPGFEPCVERVRAQETPPRHSDRSGSVLWVTLKAGAAATDLDAQWTLLDLASTDRRWPEQHFDHVHVSHILDQVPPADLSWLLDRCFGLAEKEVRFEVKAQSPSGLGSCRWWQDRVALAARRHPEVGWLLDVKDNDPRRVSGAVTSSRLRRLHRKPRVWILGNVGSTHAEVAAELATALDWPFEVKPAGSSGTPGEPGLVISADPATVKAARAVKARSPGTVRHLHIGQPRSSLEGIDLVLATTADRLPARPNIVQLTGLPIDHARLPVDEAALASWRQRLANFPQPMTALWIDGGRDAAGAPGVGYGELAAIARAVRHELERSGGSLLIHLGPGIDQQKRRDFEAALDGLVYHLEHDDEATALVFLDLADHAVLRGTSRLSMLRAAGRGKPLTLVDPHSARRAMASANPLRQLGHLIFGGGTTSRGTPHQQHWPARLIDSAIVKGWIKPDPDESALIRGLAARGLCLEGLDGTATAAPKPLDDLAIAKEAVAWMMRRVASAA